MEDNGTLVRQIFSLMNACNRAYIKQGKQPRPLPNVAIINSLNADMLLSYRAYMIYLIKKLDPLFKLSTVGISAASLGKNAKTYVPINNLPLMWPPEENNSA